MGGRDMKVLGFIAAAGLLLAQTEFAAAGNINPMSQNYNAKRYGNRATLREEQRKERRPQQQRQQRPAGGSSQY